MIELTAYLYSDEEQYMLKESHCHSSRTEKDSEPLAVSSTVISQLWVTSNTPQNTTRTVCHST
jgi:hypothetical protein